MDWTGQRWVAGPVSLALFDLDQSEDAIAAWFDLLDDAERDRASRFRHGHDRDRFVARRGQLRVKLAEEVAVAPCDLRIAADAHGKPFLSEHPRLHFNLSHSRGLALCAIGVGPVGCDIEFRDPALASRAVAERLFAPDERAALAGLPGDQWLAGFFHCWTRKEAYVKALGLGLSYPLDAFTVSVAPDEPARLIASESGGELISFEPAPGYQAAVAYGGRA